MPKTANFPAPDQFKAQPPPGVLIASHFTETRGYHVWRARGRQDWLMTYTIAGSGSYKIGAATHACGKGDIVLLRPGVPHDYATASFAPVWDFYWVHFIPRPSWHTWLQYDEIDSGLIRIHVESSTAEASLQQAFERLLRYDRLGQIEAALAQNALEEFLLLLAQAQAQRMRKLDARVERVLQQITDQFATPLTVSSLAEKVAMSPSRLAHLFKEQVGDSIIQTLLKLRLHQASRLLEFTARQVSEIATDVGFESASYFSRQFKMYYGQSPAQYRAFLNTSSETPLTATKNQ
jgi:AraC family transcriptional regulator, arabinose operon regulatory protein